jgi:putative transposase
MNLARKIIMRTKKPESIKTKKALAKYLGVARSSLYYQPKRDSIDLKLKKVIEEVMSKHPSYGHRRIALELKMNRKKILRVMNKFNLKPYRRRTKKSVKIKDANKPAAIYRNLIKNIIPNRPNLIWAADFTYLLFQDKFIYLATIMDLFTREIIGFAVSQTHDRFMCLNALNMAIMRTNAFPKYHHSDQGSEYDSREYLERLIQNKILISMNAKASPWENPFQESFYSQFKLDLGEPNRFDNLGELIEAIYRTIYDYNTTRIHTSLKMSPAQFKEQFNRRILKNKNLIYVDNRV